MVAASSLQPLTAQVAYQAADAPTTIIPRREGLLSIDLAEASLGLTFVRESDCGEACQPGGFGFAIHLSAAARKGQGSLFSQVEFVPGWKAGARITYGFGGADGSYDVLFVGSTFSTTQRRTFEINADTTEGRLDELNQHDLEFMVGYNHGFGGGSALGIGILRRKEFSTPGLSGTQEICIPGSRLGSAVIFPICSNRYPAPLGDRFVTQVRADAIAPVMRLGDAVLKPKLALIAAASVDIIAQGNPVNFGFGPAIIPSIYGGHVITSLMLELYDAFNANGVAPSIGDRFVLRLNVSVPLDVFLAK